MINSLPGIITALITLGIIWIALYFFKEGKKRERQESLENSVKESLEVKKDEEIRRNDPISIIRRRMQKFTRD